MALKYGCAHFEDTNLPRIATIARAGDYAGQRVAGTEDMSSDTVWLTNLDSNVLWARNLNNNPRFRDSKYLRQDMNQVLKAIGMDDETDERRVRATADIFRRVMQISEKILGIRHIPMRSLRWGIRERIAPPNQNLDNDLIKAINDATKFYTNCQNTTTQHVEERTLYMNPIDHAYDILSSPLPEGDWKRVRKMPQQDEIGVWIENTGPILARVTINHIEPNLASLLNYGADISVSKDNRQWLTAYELLYMISMASEIKIHEAYVPQDNCSCFDQYPQVRDVIDNYKFDCNIFSLSWSLFLDNLWTAIGVKVVDKTRGIKTETANPKNPFMRAYDRSRCLRKAMLLQEEGFDIIGYGTGKISINMAGYSDLDVFRAARKYGMMPPPSTLKFEDLHLKDEDLDDPLTLMQSFYAQSRYEDILSLDEQIVQDVICSVE